MKQIRNDFVVVVFFLVSSFFLLNLFFEIIS
jgi:hypothetical protein